MKSAIEDLKSYKIRKIEEKNEVAAMYKKVIVIELEKTEEG